MTSAPASKAATKTTTGAYNVRQYYQPRTTTNTRGGGGGGGGGVTTLMYAAQQGNVDVVRKILRIQPRTIQNRDRSGKTALHYSCTSHNICAAQVADLLVMAAPDLVDGRDEDGFTPLHLAVIAGNMQLVTFLLANKADINAVDNEKHTVVHWATVCGETAALRAVLAAGAPVSTPDIHGGYPLHYAAQMCGGDNKESTLGLQVLQTLLTHSEIDVSVTDGDQRPPLLWAASAGSTKAVLALIRAGAGVEAADKDGLTALHCAASRGHTGCIDTLLTLCGASPDVIDSNGCTALHYAVTLGHADATSLLLSHGANPNRQDRKGRSPAHCGCAKGQFETVKLIAQQGANLWLRNARGDLPLHEAAASGRRELVKWLLEMRPSQVNARNNDGKCPLHMAALNDNVDMCKILLDSGALINPVLRTSKNVFMSPLDCALQRGFRSTAKYLQLHGGLPASRIDAQQHKRQGNNSAISLQIRDDVTFWGGTSTDSEYENGERESTFKKKISYKYDRKRNSGSSDLELMKKSGRAKRKSSRGKESVLSESSGKVLDYSNEIIINGNTEINIHQTKEILLDNMELSDARNTLTTDDSVEMTVKGRPISSKCVGTSARYSARQNIKDSLEILENKQTVLIDQATNTSIENNKITEEAPIDNILSQPDQQSLLSNTSEDVEQQSPLVVEAAIHPPPKEAIEKIPTVEEVSKEIEKPSVDVPDLPQQEESAEEETVKPIKMETSIEETIQEVEATTVHQTESVEESEITEKEPDEIADEQPPTSEVSIETVLDVTAEPTVIETTKEDDELIAEKILHDIVDKSLAEITNAAPKSDTTYSEDTDTKPESAVQNESEQNNLEETDKAIVAVVEPIEMEKKTSEEDNYNSTSSDSSENCKKTHRSFRILDEEEAQRLKDKERKNRSRTLKTSARKDNRSRSEGPSRQSKRDQSRIKRSKIPTPTINNRLSRSDKQIDANIKNLNGRIPSLPNIHNSGKDYLKEPLPRCESNMSAPLLTSVYSDNERYGDSEVDEKEKNGSVRKKKLRKRPKTRESKSAGSDSNVVDSGFEPSPRSSRVTKAKNISARGVNMTSVTQSIQSNIRRYHLERKIFQQLLDLKRLQIRAGQHNEAMMVKRAIDTYHMSCASTVGAGRYIPNDYTFKSFEKFLYDALRKLQRNGTAAHLNNLPETPNPLHCTRSTHRCMHATHAYTGIPCAAYIPKMDHHTIPKIGFNDTSCKPGMGFLPTINPKKSVTLELSHGADKQVISLPTDRLDQNKRYYVTFTVKGQDNISSPSNEETTTHRHSKSD